MSNLFFKSIDNTILDLEIQDRITFIKGDSSTGKTLLINIIKNAIVNKVYTKECNVDIGRFVVIGSESGTGTIEKIKNKAIVFVDRYDSFSQEGKERIWGIMRDVSAAWIIMTQYPDFPDYTIKGSYGFRYLKFTVNEDSRIFTISKDKEE